MDHAKIKSLLADAQSSLQAYEADEVEATRKEALERVLKLARAIEKPRDAILKLGFSPTILMAVKVAVDLDVFNSLCNASASVPVDELAAPKSADPLLVERIMRLLVAHGYADESAPCEYFATALSKEMTQRTSIGVVESIFLDLLPAAQKTPEFLQKTGYQNPEEPTNGPLQYTNNINVDTFTWLCQNPESMTRFNAFMQGQRADRVFWADWFPVQERILDGADKSADGPLLVDIGGGLGHDLLGFKERFPDAPGRLILEDLPEVVEDGKATLGLEAAGIDAVSHDFFAEEQPVKGARVYYFKNIMHDWSDEKLRLVFKLLATAMKPGYSKIILEEYILPDMGARSLESMTDLGILVFCTGMERTRQRWINLMDSVGLKAKFWTREGDAQGIIEAEFP
ncbi:S-adenosyl-L-methionine-dependent methyltransferase, partial [Aspergillus avenaceus]